MLFDDELVLVSRQPMASPDLGRSYVYVDHGEEFRRQHAAAFPGDLTSALTVASSDWALDHLLAKGGSGYLPARHIHAEAVEGRLFAVPSAPRFSRRVYVVENVQAVKSWPWYAHAMNGLRRP